MQIIKTVCGMCGGDNCGIDVHVEDGKVLAVRGSREHPLNGPRTCPQAAAVADLAVDPARLSYPMRRSGADWERITWDDALDSIAEHLTRLRAEHGAQALAVYIGRSLLQFLKSGWPQRFLSLYGSPNLVRNDHMCSYPSRIAEQLTYGSTTVYGFEAEHTRCMVLWGANPATSHIPFIWHDLQAARRAGCRLIVIDPRVTIPARPGDLYAAPRPGTDLALALGLIHVIIHEELYARDFVAGWTVGFADLAERARDYPPERVAEITGVPAATVQEIARAYATTSPAYLDAGNALEHHSNSGQTLRAMAVLRAITGNLDVPGGHVLLDPLPLADMRLAERRPACPPLGRARYPIFVDRSQFVPGDSLIEAILDGRPYRVRSMIMAGGNPALTWPESRRVHRALDTLDFLAVMDLYPTATALHASLMLPAASALEKTQLVVRAGPHHGAPSWYITLRRPVLDPGERRSDWWFWAELSRRLGYGEFFPWQSEEEAIDAQLAPLGLSVAALERSPGGLFYGEPPAYRKYVSRGFATPSGKVELSSAELAAAGQDPVPGYVEPAESPASQPALAAEYPLVLDCGRRSPFYTHSQHRGLPKLRRADPEPYAEIHPAAAARHGIADGDWVRVISPRGQIELRARLTPGIRTDTISLLHGWSQANANELTDSRACDPIVASPPLRSGLCRVERCAPPAAEETL